MITIKRTVYKCEHCGKCRFTKRAMVNHEKRCWKNPNRQPYKGELTRHIQVLYLELEYRDEVPPWWPNSDQVESEDGAGCIYDGERWHDVPGYRVAALQCAVDDWTYVDDWPQFWGAPLNEVPMEVRADHISDILAGKTGPDK